MDAGSATTTTMPSSKAQSLYKAFISYSHHGDGKLAQSLQSGLHRIARPWYRLRTMRVFRDQTSLALTPELWPAIKKALDESEFFLLLASPQAAASKWVQDEIGYWLADDTRKRRLLILVTDGDLVWDRAAGDFDWRRTTALPRRSERDGQPIPYDFREEPFWEDLRWARTADQLSPRNGTFQNALASVASTMLGRSKDELVGEDVRRHRQTKRIAGSAATLLVLLTVTSILAAVVAVRNQRTAEERQRLARARQLGAQSAGASSDGLHDRALLLSLEAHDPPYTFEARNALLTALESNPRILTFLRGHRASIRAVAYSVAGDVVASASGDGEIRLWDGATFEPSGQPLKEHTDAVFSLAFSRDGRWLASGSRDLGSNRPLLFWDVAASRSVGPESDAQSGAISGMAVSPDGALLASGAGDRTIVLWDIPSRTPIASPLVGHESNVVSLSFSADGALLASGGWDGQVVLWDVSSRQPAGRLPRQRGQVETVAFQPRGALLATAGGTGVDLWEIRRNGAAAEAVLKAHLGAAGRGNALAFSPDGRVLASGGTAEGPVLLWNVTTEDLAGTALPGRTGGVNALAFSPDGQTLLAGTEENIIIAYDLRLRTRVGELIDTVSGQVQSLVYSPDGSRLAAAACASRTSCASIETVLWRLGSPPAPARLEVATDTGGGGLAALAFSPDGRALHSSTCADIQGGYRCHGIRRRQRELAGVAWADLPSPGDIGEVERMTWSPNRRWLAFAQPVTAQVPGQSSGWSVQLMDTAAQQTSGDPMTIPGLPVAMRFSADEKILAVSAVNDEVYLFDVSSRWPMYEPIQGHQVAFTPGGDTLVTVHKTLRGSNSILLWVVGTGQRIRETQTTLDAVVTSLALSPDGRLLALGDASGSLVLWDLPEDRQLGRPLAFHQESLTALAFAPDGRALVSGDADGAIVHWTLDFDAWRRRACRTASRNLTYTEWVQFLAGEPYSLTCQEWPVHSTLLEAGTRLAEAGQVDSAVTIFRRATALDSTLDLDPRAEATKLALPSLLDRAKQLAARGNIAAAAELFTRADRLGAELALDPMLEAKKAAAPRYLDRSRSFARSGRIDAAQAALDTATSFDPALPIDPAQLGELCWYGVLWDRARDVIHACDRAVAEAVDRSGTSTAFLHESRGLARMRTGDLTGALEDLRKALDVDPRYRMGLGARRDRRIREWIAAIEAGETQPLDTTHLKELRETADARR